MRRHALVLTGLMVGVCFLVAIGTATVTASTFTVNSTADTDDGSCDPLNTGDCTLREAINAANANSGADTIEFNIPKTDSGYSVGVSGTWTISLTSSLPSLSDDETTIDGHTQAVNQGDTNPDGPEIEITGASLGSGSCLSVDSDQNKIRGLVINWCPHDGIDILSGRDANVISGNYIGTDATGSVALGNGHDGVHMEDGCQDNLVGGDTTAERNVISGNDSDGVYIYGSGTMSNTISGNYIGTDASGAVDLGNSHTGVLIVGAQANVIGGDTPGERNIISGNEYDGVAISGSGTTSNTISGNYIGTDATGTVDLGNGVDGVWISGGAQANVIGGDTPGERNIISGNAFDGVAISGSGTMSNTVSGNYIGTDASGALDLGNSWEGVCIYSFAQANVIGGDTVGERNIIAFNDLDGVLVDGATTGNTITQNSIHSNGGLGIDLSSGGNTELTPPTITTADCFAVYSGTAPSNATVELFTGPDEEGKTYLTSVSADGAGNWSASGFLADGTYLTATATDVSGNTSEFSAAPPGWCNHTYVPLVMKGY